MSVSVNLPPVELVAALQGVVGALYLLVAVLLIAGWQRMQVVAVVAVIGGILLHGALLGWRWYAQQQMPMVTRYEDLTLDALFIVMIWLVIQYRDPALRRAAALMLVVAGTLVLGALLYSQQYYPWSPALRIFWLQIHAPLNSLSIAMATLCASLALLGGREQAARCTRLLWWVLLLWGAMVATGSYWAWLAWGRFWGWDPIESWALATALAYAAVCHLTLRPAWGGIRSCRLALLPYAMLLFTTYGLMLVRYSMHGQYLFR